MERDESDEGEREFAEASAREPVALGDNVTSRRANTRATSLPQDDGNEPERDTSYDSTSETIHPRFTDEDNPDVPAQQKDMADFVHDRRRAWSRNMDRDDDLWIEFRREFGKWTRADFKSIGYEGSNGLRKFLRIHGVYAPLTIPAEISLCKVLEEEHMGSWPRQSIKAIMEATKGAWDSKWHPDNKEKLAQIAAATMYIPEYTQIAGEAEATAIATPTGSQTRRSAVEGDIGLGSPPPTQQQRHQRQGSYVPDISQNTNTQAQIPIAVPTSRTPHTPLPRYSRTPVNQTPGTQRLRFEGLPGVRSPPASDILVQNIPTTMTGARSVNGDNPKNQSLFEDPSKLARYLANLTKMFPDSPFEKLIDTLRKEQPKLELDQQTDGVLRAKLYRCVLGFPEFEAATLDQEPTFEQAADRLLIGLENRINMTKMAPQYQSRHGNSLPPGGAPTLYHAEHSAGSNGNELETAYLTDRKYGGQSQRYPPRDKQRGQSSGPNFRPQRHNDRNDQNNRSSSNLRGKSSAPRIKICFVCKKSECWSTNHTDEEIAREKERYKRQKTWSDSQLQAYISISQTLKALTLTFPKITNNGSYQSSSQMLIVKATATKAS